MRALAPKLALARAVGAVSRRGGRGGTSLPGKLLVRMEPRAICALAGRLERGSALISATNGKTTTAALAASVFERSGVSLVHNQAGANMAGGIASTLLAASRRGGEIDGELGLFEVDEFWLDRMIGEIAPRAVLLGNLFRDQLDRYGELDAIAERWRSALESPRGRQARLVCNADDPVLADLGRARAGAAGAGAEDRVTADGARGAAGAPGAQSGETLFFGIEDDSLSLPGMSHAADAKHCRRCGAPYAFDAIYLGHLGRYHCPSCGQRRPTPAVYADRVTLEGVRRSRFRLTTPAGSASVELALPGVYNVYNALAAAALATALDVPLATIVDGLQGTGAAFGRAETVTVAGRATRILLVKNPAGANEVLRTLALEHGEHDLLGVLNDRTADGHDVSWIWDADFELLAGRVRRAVCAGTRAAELALRLKYAGVQPERIEVVEDLARALDRAVAGGDRGAPLYVLPTYTAMLALRELLVRRGEARSSWR
jgi:lipid II isoglutaminyl synthase (glutamine-hydrolysing)